MTQIDDEALAKAVYDAICEANTDVAWIGDFDMTDFGTTIDGSFNMLLVAQALRKLISSDLRG